MFFKNKNKKLIIFSALSVFIFVFSNFVSAQETTVPKNGDICSSSPSCPSGVPKDATFNKEKNAWDYYYSIGVGEAISTGHDYYSHPEGKKTSTDDNLLGSGVSRKETTDENGDSKSEYSGGGFGSFLSDIGSSIFEKGVGFILVYVCAPVASFVFTLGSWLVNFSLELNSTVMKMPIVKAGWSFCRDFANLGFVLGILVISFSTILRQRQYGMQSLLFKFIQTAILINFSLVISGIIIDFAGIITAYFLNSAATMTGNGDLASGLANLLRIKELSGINGSSASIPEGVTLLGTNFVVGLLSLVFSIVFTVFSAIILLALAIMLLYRFVALAFLLILSPLAWFSSIFPRINQSGKWWSSFLNWVFFAPISSFFIYLSVSSLNITESDIQSAAGSSGLAESIGALNIIQGGLGQIAGMIIVLGFLLGSIIVANKLGITGAAVALGYANGFKNWTLGKMKRGAVGSAKFGYGQTIGRSGIAKTVKDWAEEGIKSEKSGRLKLLAAKTVLGTTKKTSDSIFKKYKDDAKNLSPEEISASARLARDPVKKAALQELLAEKGKLDKYPEYIDPTLFEKYGGDSRKLSSSNILYSSSKDKKDKDAKSVVEAVNNLSKIDKTKAEEFNQAISNLEKSLIEALSKMKTEDIKKGAWIDIAEKGLGSGMDKNTWIEKGGRDAFYQAIAGMKPKEFNAITKSMSPKDRNVFANRTTLALVNKSISSPDQPLSFGDGVVFSMDITKDESFIEKEKELNIQNSELLNHLKKINTLTADDSGGEKKEEEKSEDKKGEKK